MGIQWVSFQICPVFGCQVQNIVAIGPVVPTHADWYEYTCPNCHNRVAFPAGTVCRGGKFEGVIHAERSRRF